MLEGERQVAAGDRILTNAVSSLCTCRHPVNLSGLQNPCEDKTYYSYSPTFFPSTFCVSVTMLSSVSIILFHLYVSPMR